MTDGADNDRDDRRVRLPLPDRRTAGIALAERLSAYRGRRGGLVLALPRGGVPVGFEIASALRLPLDIVLVRKLGVPGQEEMAMGAIASGGIEVFNRSLVERLGIAPEQIAEVVARERRELERRERVYRGERPRLDPRGRTVVLVDDGAATGATMRAAVAALRRTQPAELVVALPTASEDAYEELRTQVDELVCLATPEPYVAVGVWYRQFGQVDDHEVQALLARAAVPDAEAG